MSLTGKDLIDMGFEPAPWFGDALEEINGKSMSRSQAHRVANRYIDEINRALDERKAREKPLREHPAPYQFNITVEEGSEAEIENINAVKATFDELMRTPVLETGAVMPDACPAGPMGTIPVGGVIAARDAIHVS